jgi:hypothetical protein
MKVSSAVDKNKELAVIRSFCLKFLKTVRTTATAITDFLVHQDCFSSAIANSLPPLTYRQHKIIERALTGGPDNEVNLNTKT